MTEGDIRRAEREINALHQRIYQTYRLRSNSDAHQREWREACGAFRLYHTAFYGLWETDILARVRLAAGPERSDALLFLEVDPWFFRSGYLKERLLRALKQAQLLPEEGERLVRICLIAVDSRYRREFRDYCRVASKIGTPGLRAALATRLESSDPGVRDRASKMLRHLDAHGAA